MDKVKKAVTFRAKEVSFIPDEKNYTIQAEGELYDNVPLEAHIVEGKLKLYLPE